MLLKMGKMEVRVCEYQNVFFEHLVPALSALALFLTPPQCHAPSMHPFSTDASLVTGAAVQSGFNYVRRGLGAVL